MTPSRWQEVESIYQAALERPEDARAAFLTKNLNHALGIADIVAVNGQSVTGTHRRSAVNINFRTAPSPGQAIADTVRNALAVATFEILKSDGTPIGTIVAEGFAGGTAPPGSPSSITGGNDFVITGGTEAFLGARGQVGVAANPPGVAVQRAASMTEDPASRRLNGGGTQRWVAYLIPMSAPQIINTASGPAVTHSSDFSLVTSSKPAVAGEVLSLFATGLGPTVPAVDPGQPFPSTPLAAVNSPIEVEVNGECRRSARSSRLPRLAGRLPSELSDASGCGKRSSEHSSNRGLDCWNCGADRGSVSIGHIGSERRTYPASGSRNDIFEGPE